MCEARPWGNVGRHFASPVELLVRRRGKHGNNQIFQRDHANMERPQFGGTNFWNRNSIFDRCGRFLRAAWPSSSFSVPSGQRSLKLRRVVWGIGVSAGHRAVPSKKASSGSSYNPPPQLPKVAPAGLTQATSAPARGLIEFKVEAHRSDLVPHGSVPLARSRLVSLPPEVAGQPRSLLESTILVIRRSLIADTHHIIAQQCFVVLRFT